MVIHELTNEQIIERVNAWQNAGFVHPLTCINSKHPNLIPFVDGKKVKLKCTKCSYVQENIPPSILTIDPELIKSEKERLKNQGFVFAQ